MSINEKNSCEASGETQRFVDQPGSPAELQRWLDRQRIDTSDWGSGDAKSVVALWQEIANGETSLGENPPVRITRVIQLLIRREGALLHEVEQELWDGRRRRRNRPPTEKQQGDESVVQAALRGISEELCVEPANVRILHQEPPNVIELDSPSYPGLTTHYMLSPVVVEIDGLPDEPFWTEEPEGNAHDPVVRHRWEWVSGEGVL